MIGCCKHVKSRSCPTLAVEQFFLFGKIVLYLLGQPLLKSHKLSKSFFVFGNDHFVLVDLGDVLAPYNHLLLLASINIRSLVSRNVPVVRGTAFDTVHAGSLSPFHRLYRLRIHGSHSQLHLLSLLTAICFFFAHFLDDNVLTGH